MILDFYSRPGCGLCKEALRVLRELQREFPFEIRVIDISGSPELTVVYGNDIPVGVIEGKKVFKHRVDKKMVRRVLKARTSE